MISDVMRIWRIRVFPKHHRPARIHLRPSFHTTQRMAESKTKSESEWRAILSPEQVCASMGMKNGSEYRMRSLGSCVKRGQRLQELVNTTNTLRKGFIPALAAEHRFTRAVPSSRVVVDGLPSLMVMLVTAFCVVGRLL